MDQIKKVENLWKISNADYEDLPPEQKTAVIEKYHMIGIKEILWDGDNEWLLLPKRVDSYMV